MFDNIHHILDTILALDEDAAWRFSVDRNVKRMIIKLNTVEQLGKEGIDSMGDSLGTYAPFTIHDPVKGRIAKGYQVNHIDFKQTGEYWKSWEVRVTNDEIEIEVDPVRFNELVNDLRFDPDHVGLTQDHWNIIIDMILDNHLTYIDEQL